MGHTRLLTAAAVWAGLMTAMPASAQERQGGTAAPAPDADREVALVTGSTDGLGREVALRLGAAGTHVIVHGRNAERGAAVVDEIRRGGGSASFHAADFASLAAVRALAEVVLRDYGRLDVLVNNAGIWLNRSTERQLSDDGHELHFAVNYLAGYLLTELLLPRLRAAPAARIINVASGAQTPLDFSDVMLGSGYSGGRAYGQSKLAQVLFTVDLAERLRDSNITVAALHPATLMETSMVREAGVPARATVDEGADAVMQLIRGDVESGAYYNGLRPARANAQAYDASARARLRQLSERLVETSGGSGTYQ